MTEQQARTKSSRLVSASNDRVSELQVQARAALRRVAHPGADRGAEARRVPEGAVPARREPDGHLGGVLAGTHALELARLAQRGALGALLAEIEERGRGQPHAFGHRVALIEADDARLDGAEGELEV